MSKAKKAPAKKVRRTNGKGRAVPMSEIPRYPKKVRAACLRCLAMKRERGGEPLSFNIRKEQNDELMKMSWRDRREVLSNAIRRICATR